MNKFLIAAAVLLMFAVQVLVEAQNVTTAEATTAAGNVTKSPTGAASTVQATMMCAALTGAAMILFQ